MSRAGDTSSSQATSEQGRRDPADLRKDIEGSGSADPTKEGTRDPQEIRKDIEETREELGETAAAVAEKTDVKKQTQAKADELKSQAAAKAQEAKAKAQELSEKAKEAAPDSAGEGAQQAQRIAQENPVPMALAGAFLAGMVVGRLLSR